MVKKKKEREVRCLWDAGQKDGLCPCIIRFLVLFDVYLKTCLHHFDKNTLKKENEKHEALQKFREQSVSRRGDYTWET